MNTKIDLTVWEVKISSQNKDAENLFVSNFTLNELGQPSRYAVRRWL